MTSGEIIRRLNEGTFLSEKAEMLSAEQEELSSRLKDLLERFGKAFGEGRDLSVFSVSGRTELCGNHTDHNHGLVMAAGVNADLLAVASPRDDGVVDLRSLNFAPDRVSLREYTVPKKELFYTSVSLIAGVAAGLRERGYEVGGFSCVTESRVPAGSGLSSSAAFEVAVGTVLNHLYNGGRIPQEEIAIVAKEAENRFFGKPCGLMDQMACALGGVTAMDFQNPEKPSLTRLDFYPEKEGYVLALTSTGGSHADLNDDYAAVPGEMKKIASCLGHQTLRETPEEDFSASLPLLREKCGDRAVLRALHFYEENRRVERLTALLKEGGEVMPAFCDILSESGASSLAKLQNIFSVHDASHQGISLALALSGEILRGTKAVCRVHGGGFAGAVQTFLPRKLAPDYVKEMDRVFGEGACRLFRIRHVGAVKLL
ncbi:MAG: galactokinase [Clostridia bacterium]|nr:galactokinase [Clostridia bacterium]